MLCDNPKLFLITLLITGLFLAACGGGAAEAPAPEKPAAEEAAAPAEEAEAPAEEAAPGEKVTIRWFVGLGAGSDQPTFAAQEQVVADYNASQDKIELVLEIVDANVAPDTLATQIAGGNAPDICRRR